MEDKLIALTDMHSVLNRDGKRILFQMAGERTKLDGCYRKPTFIDRILGRDIYICIYRSEPVPDSESELHRYYIPKSLFEKHGKSKVLTGDIDKYEVK